MAKIQGQLENAQLENKSSDYSAGVAGRTWWNTTDGQQKVDDATNVRAVLRNDLKAIIGNSGTSSQNVRFHRSAAAVLQLVLANDATAEGSYGSFAQLSAKIESFSTAGRPSAGNAGRIIYDTDLSTLLCDNGSSWETLVTLDNSQILTNKDVDGGTASNSSRITIPKATKSTLDGLTRKQGTLVFASDESILYIDDGTTLVPVGSGSSGINYIDNSDAAAGVSLWATYADAAGTTPVDGTGGSPNITLTRTTSSPLRGSGSFLITKDAANRQGEGVSTDFTIDNADKNKTLGITFDWEVASGTFVAGESSDLRVFIYDVTNATLIYPDNVYLLSQGRFAARFSASSSTSYRLIIHVATTSASAYTVKYDNVQVGPQTIVYGPAMTDWITYSPTLSATTSNPSKGTIVRDLAQWRRVGDSMEISWDFEQSSAGTTGTGTYLLPLPTGYSIDTNKLSVSTTNEVIIGQGFIFTSADGLSSTFAISVTAYDANNLSWSRITTSAGNLVTNWLKCASTDATSAFNNNPFIVTFRARVPISGWSTNVVSANSSSFEISSILANGTRVTSAPTKLGEYRSRYKSGATSNTFSDVAPTTTPTSADGIRIHAIDYTAAQTSGQISLYDIFVGKGKFVNVRFFALAAKTGQVYTDYRIASSTISSGVTWFYDPSTGVVTVNAGTNELNTNSTRNLGTTDAAGAVTNGYFEIYVSENALAVQQDTPNSEIHVIDDAGFGSTNTAIRRYNTTVTSTGPDITYASSATLGDSFTINRSGFYHAYVTGDFSSSNPIGISLNSSQLTSSIATITNSNRKAMVVSSAANQQLQASVVLKLSVGDVLRAHSSASATAGANSGTSSFRVIRIS